jgi:hypothetical protein
VLPLGTLKQRLLSGNLRAPTGGEHVAKVAASRPHSGEEQSAMRDHLPRLTNALLQLFLDSSFGLVGSGTPPRPDDAPTAAVLDALMAMAKVHQMCGAEERSDLFPRLHPILRFEPNSEGTDLQLSMLLAIRDLYRLSLKELMALMRSYEPVS